jgi:hypothetical protein
MYNIDPQVRLLCLKIDDDLLKKCLFVASNIIKYIGTLFSITLEEVRPL